MTTDYFDIDPVNDQPAQTFASGRTKQRDIKSLRLVAIATADDKVSISEPSSPAQPEYPNNKVTQTTSGHLEEVDDTPGAERLLRMHKSGTFEEIHPDGKKVTKIFGEDFYIILDDHNLVVGGTLNITVNSDAHILINGDMKTKVSGNYDLVVHGDMNTHVEGKVSTYAKGEINIQSKSNINLKSDMRMQFYSASHFNIQSGGSTSISAAGTSRYFSSGRTFMDASRLDFNLPLGAPPNVEIPVSDIGAGLTVSKSVFEPRRELVMTLRADNVDLVDILPTDDITYPRDRVPKT